jgi:phage antirepressor YoqD-like protein
MENLQMIKSENFGTAKCDFWQDAGGNILVTRRQIGQALGYSDPQKAIDNLHSKHDNRLNQFSVTLKVRGTDGKDYDTCLYSYKGIMELCRWSQQPKADAFMDWVWNVMETIRKTGTYSMVPKSFAEALRLAADLEEEKQMLLPKAEQFDRFISGENLQDMNTAAKTLGWGRNKLFNELRRRKVLMSNNNPYQEYIDRGYLQVKEKPIKMGDKEINKAQTYVTARGLDWLAKMLA